MTTYQKAVNNLRTRFVDLRSYTGTATETKHRRRVQRAALRLMDLDSSQETVKDVTEAERLIDRTASYLIDHNLYRG